MQIFWGSTSTLAVLGVLGAWFAACGRAERMRRARDFAKRTFVYAGTGFLLGVAFLTSDLGTPQPQGRIGLLAITVCCFLLLYAAVWGLIAANDKSHLIVNLTGRMLVVTDRERAPLLSLPAPRDQAATVLPPMRPRTYYVVTPELGEAGAREGRTDLFTVDAESSTDYGDGPLLVRRLARVMAVTPPEALASAVVTADDHDARSG